MSVFETIKYCLRIPIANCIMFARPTSVLDP